MLTEKEYFGRWTSHPERTEEINKNAKILLSKVSFLLSLYGKELTVTSGFRPRDYNTSIKGAPNSAHIFGCAIDLWDPDKSFGKFCLDNIEILKEQGLYMETLIKTHHRLSPPKKWWVHLQTIRPKSGNIVFGV